MPFRLLYGMASPAQHTGPGMMRGLAAADGVLVVPPHGVQLGEPVPAFALPWGAPIPDAGAAAAKPRHAPRKAGTEAPCRHRASGLERTAGLTIAGCRRRRRTLGRAAGPLVPGTLQ